MPGPIADGAPKLVPYGQNVPRRAQLPQATEGRNVGGTSATFFKGIGKSVADAFQAIGRGIAKLGPKTTPIYQNLSPQAKATFQKYQSLMAKAEKLSNAGEAKKTELAKVRTELSQVRQAVIVELRQQLHDSPLYKAAGNEPNEEILNNTEQAFVFDNPQKALDGAFGGILMDMRRVDAIVKKGLSIDQAVAIFTYTQGAYVGINAEIRGGKPGDFIQTLTDCVTSGLAKLPPHEEPCYRVMTVPPSIDAKYAKGMIVADPGILSTTASVEFNYQGADKSHALSIAPKENSAGRDVSWLAEMSKEKEVIFPPGTQFKVLYRDVDTCPQVTGQTPTGTPTFDKQVGILMVEV